jgi:uncharacterized protein
MIWRGKNMSTITISVGDIVIQAELFETPTAEKIKDALPLEGRTHVWGEEIYFEIPISVPLDANARAGVEVGELGYWPSGPAFCLFFGPTPVSTDEKPRAYSPVNIFGRILGDVKPLRSVPDGESIRIDLSTTDKVG